MIQTIRNIIADQLIEWAIKLYKGKIQLSLCEWVINNFPERLNNES